MIFLWGRVGEDPLLEVQRELAKIGAPVFFLNEDRAPATTCEFAYDGSLAGTLRVDGTSLALADVSAAYLRPYGAERLLTRVELPRRAAVSSYTGALHAAIFAWADITPARVLNRPALMASNCSKPLQSMILERLGFGIPPTLVTTDADAARAFIDTHELAIYKSVSAVRSIVKRIDRTIAAERLADVAACPTQFQAYVAGTDVRVHVVGDEVFAVEIVSDVADYRYSARSNGSTRLSAYTLPAEIETRCRSAATALGLPLCGIDLRRTPDGRWFAFEANPSPGYTYFARATGAPIAAAIARYLAAA